MSESATGKKKNVPRDAFIEAWETGAALGESVEEIGKRVGLSRNSCAARATSYRKNKTPLSKLGRKGAGRKFDVEAANATLERVRKQIAEKAEQAGDEGEQGQEQEQESGELAHV